MKKPPVAGQYDIWRGAASYSPIISAFGSLAVPTVPIVLLDGEIP